MREAQGARRVGTVAPAATTGVLRRSGRRRRPDGRSPRDARGSGACVRSRARSRARTPRPGRGTRGAPRNGCEPAFPVPRPPSSSGRAANGRSVRRPCRPWRRTFPTPSAMYPRSTSWPANAATRPSYAAARSRRRPAGRKCHGRVDARSRVGLLRPRVAISGKRASNPLTRVPSGVPAPGCTTRPAGLSIDGEIVVGVHDVEDDARVGIHRRRRGLRHVDFELVTLDEVVAFGS